MAGGKRSIMIEVLGDTKQFVQSTKKAGDASMTLEDKVRAVGKAVASTYIAKQIVGFGFAVAKVAGDLAESQSKVAVIFGESADAIDDWSSSAATALGMSQQEALDAASTFATFGKAAGLAGEDLTGFSTELAGLGADLASFHNTSPEDAILALGAALRGESEPIRRYGVMLDDATLKQRARTMGIYDGVGALTTEQKVLAAQSEILAQTTDAQGDFNRTKASAANQLRILSAQYENMQAVIGQALLPVMTQMIGVMTSAFTWFNELDPAIREVMIALGLGAGAAYVAAAGMHALNAAMAAFGLSAQIAQPWLMGISVAIGAIAAAAMIFGDDVDEAKERAESFYDTVAIGIKSIDRHRLAMMSSTAAVAEFGDAIYAEADKKLQDSILGNEEYVKSMQELGLTIDDLKTIVRGGAAAEALLVRQRRESFESGKVTIKLNGQLIDSNHEVAQGWINTGTAMTNYQGKVTVVKGAVNNLINELEHEVTAQYDSAEAAVARMAVGDVQAAFWLQGTGALADLNWNEQLNARLLIASATAADSSTASTSALVTANDLLTTSVAATNTKLSAAALAASEFKAAIDAVFAPAMNLETANRALNAGIEEMTAHFTAVDAEGRKLSTTLDINTQRGRDNREILQGRTEDIIADGVAMVAHGASLEEATAAIDSQAESLRLQAEMLGINTEEADEFINTIGLTPEKVQTALEIAEYDTRKRELEGLLEQLVGIDAGAKAEIQADIDQGQFDAAEADIRDFAANNGIKLKVSMYGSGNIDVDPKPSGKGFVMKAWAKGGNAFAGDVGLVGEDGPELVSFGANSTVHPADATERILSRGEAGRGGGDDTYITIDMRGAIVTPAAIGKELGQVLSDTARRHGRDVTTVRRVPV